MKFEKESANHSHRSMDYNKGTYCLEEFGRTVSLQIVLTTGIVEYFNGNIVFEYDFQNDDDVEVHRLLMDSE